MTIITRNSNFQTCMIIMDNSFALLAFVSIVSIAFLFKLLTKKSHHLRKPPPGPKPWPILGNLNLMITSSNLHMSFHNLSKKYGPIMQLSFSKSPLVVVSSPEMAKHFLKTHDTIFASRPPFATGKYTNYDYSDVLWAPAGPYWRQVRKITTTVMFSTNRIEFFKHIRVRERRKFLSHLRSLSGEPIVIRDHVERHLLYIVCRMVLGDEYFSESMDGSKAKLDELQKVMDEWFRLNGTFYIGDWIPWLSTLVGAQGHLKKMRTFRNKFDMIIDSLIDDHIDKMKKKNFVPKDVIDGLLQIANDPNLDVQLTRDCLKAIIMDLLAGGTDSSTITIEWAIHEMNKQPRIIKHLKEELVRVVGRNKWVTENEISQLPYMDAIIMETMRMHPPVTLLPPHYATEECNVAGYDISKGSIVMINAWSIGRDPITWDDPQKFLPERFLSRELAEMFGNNFALLPFGSGRRMCPGYNLGLNSIRSTLANLLHGFDWKLPEGMKTEDVCTEEAYSLTTRPKVPLAIILVPTINNDY